MSDHLRAPRWRAQHEGWVEGDENVLLGKSLGSKHSAGECSHGLVAERGEEMAHGGVAEKHQHPSLRELELAVEKRQTRFDLFPARHTILRGTALDDVCYEHILAGIDSRLFDHRVEQTARAPDERPPLAVLLGARTLADDDDPRFRRSAVDHDVCSCRMKGAHLTARCAEPISKRAVRLRSKNICRLALSVLWGS